MSFSFGLLPSAVLNEIFRLVSFQNKFRCEQVCRGWRKLLKCSAAGGAGLCPSWTPGVWGTKLCINHMTTIRDQFRIKIDASSNSLVSLTLTTHARADRESWEQLLTWLAEHAAGFLKVHLFTESIYDCPWLFARIVFALGAAGMSAPSACEVHLDADIAVIHSPSFCELLGHVIVDFTIHEIEQTAGLLPLINLTHMTSLRVEDGSHLGSMTELRHLQRLGELHITHFSELANKAPSFHHLQTLHLSHSLDDILDLTSCSSVTRLCLDPIGKVVTQILLPTGDRVRLQDLSLGRARRQFVMMNLEMACQLTQLKLLDRYPSNFRADTDWPVHLRHLESLSLTWMVHDLPLALTSCPGLRYLDLSHYQQKVLPLWLSSMTQLTLLDLMAGRLTQFPEHILHLSQLRRLHMTNRPAFLLSKSVMGFAHWPNLLTLRFTSVDDETVPLESQLIILQLHRLLKTNNKHCQLHY